MKPVTELEKFLDDVELNQISVFLYGGSNIYKNLEFYFTACSVNGASVAITSKPLPQGLGKYVFLGNYEKGSTVLVKCAILTQDIPTGTQLALGIFRNGSLSNRTPLSTVLLERFNCYESQADFVV